ncbi:MAG: DUF1659 domain-containing protein [Coprothermobacterota bacterium]|jgi:hypothetical protein|nr:DUF1659 domain-containing protein [Caldisericota bacterium]MDI6868163.1 DUF1659 domain-containing protein [Coprothermobacterota bacterium]
MPINANPYPSRLTLRLNAGTNEQTGRPILRTVSFNNVRPDATLDNLYATAQDLAGLMELPLYSVEKVDRSELLSM